MTDYRPCSERRALIAGFAALASTMGGTKLMAAVVAEYAVINTEVVQ